MLVPYLDLDHCNGTAETTAALPVPNDFDTLAFTTAAAYIVVKAS
jgi:hypothetical protein